MGVKGLTTFVRSLSLSSVADHMELSNGNHIVVVDGSGFVYALCQQERHMSVFNTNYRALRARVIEWVRRVMAAGVGLVFVFDGAVEQSKLPCKVARMEKQATHVHEALSVLNGLATTADDLREVRLSSTPPLLAVNCILGALYDCIRGGAQCRALFADGEADAAIVRVALAVSAISILSNDSDMIIFNTQKVGIVPFWAFGFAEDDDSMHAWVMRQNKIAALLGIDVTVLPLLAALAGNDGSDGNTCDAIQRAFLYSGDDENRKRARTSSGQRKGKVAGGKTAKERERERRRANRKEEAGQRDTHHPPSHHCESALTTIKAAAAFLRKTATVGPVDVTSVSAALADEDTAFGHLVSAALQTAVDFYVIPQTARVRCCFCCSIGGDGGGGCTCAAWGAANENGRTFEERVGHSTHRARSAPVLSPQLQQLRISGTYIARTSCAGGGIDASGGYAVLRAFRQQTYAAVLGSLSSSSADVPCTVTEILRSEGTMITCAVAVPPQAVSTPCDPLDQIRRWVSLRRQSPPSSTTTSGGTLDRQLCLVGLTVDLFCSCWCVSSDATWRVPAVAFVVATASTLRGDGPVDDFDAERELERMSRGAAYVDAWALLQLCVLHVNDAVEALMSTGPECGLDVGLLDEQRYRRAYWTLTAAASTGNASLLCAAARRELGGIGCNGVGIDVGGPTLTMIERLVHSI